MGKDPAQSLMPPAARPPFPPREGNDQQTGIPEGQEEAFAEFMKSRQADESVPRESHNAQMAKLRKRGDSMEKMLREREAEIAKLKADSVPEPSKLVKEVMADAVVTTEDGHSYLDPEKVTEGFAKLLEIVQQKTSSTSQVDVEAKIEEAFALRPLSSEQRDAVMEMREQYPGLPPEKLVNLARMESPELFADTAGQTAFANAPGRGSSEEQTPKTGQPSSRDIAEMMMSLDPDDPRAGDLGPMLIKAEMDENYPGIHGPGR